MDYETTPFYLQFTIYDLQFTTPDSYWITICLVTTICFISFLVLQGGKRGSLMKQTHQICNLRYTIYDLQFDRLHSFVSYRFWFCKEE